MSFHTFQPGSRPPTPPAQTNAPASSMEQPVLVPGGATVTAIPPHHAFASLTLSSEAEKPNEAAQFYGNLKNRLLEGEEPTAAMLQQAINAGNGKAVSLLLKNGGDPNWAIENCSDENVENTLKLSNLLLEHGADINRKNKNGNTLLHHACKLGDVTRAERLIKLGANPRIMNGKYESCIGMAFACPNDKQRHLLPILAKADQDTPYKILGDAIDRGRWDVMAWSFADGWAHPALWATTSNACSTELLQHLKDCFWEALIHNNGQQQKNCVVTMTYIALKMRRIRQEMEFPWTNEDPDRQRIAYETIDIPGQAQAILKNWITAVPELKDTYEECANKIKGGDQMVL